MTPDDPRHGTHAGHVAGCRQQCCRDGAARYERGRAWDVLRGQPRTVPALGARRRINALQAIGWSAEDLSQRLGHSRAWLNVTVNHRESGLMYRRNFDKIAALYDELCMTPGPSEITRKRAARKGWHAPLAWDDIDNDPEPPAHEDAGEVDPVLVERVVAGEFGLSTTPAERGEVARRWVESGRSLRALRDASGWKPERYLKLGEDAA